MGKDVWDLEKNPCSAFKSLTHPEYIDAACYGCEYYRTLTDIEYCMLECDIEKKSTNTRVFGLIIVNVRVK